MFLLSIAALFPYKPLSALKSGIRVVIEPSNFAIREAFLKHSDSGVHQTQFHEEGLRIEIFIQI